MKNIRAQLKLQNLNSSASSITKIQSTNINNKSDENDTSFNLTPEEEEPQSLPLTICNNHQNKSKIDEIKSDEENLYEKENFDEDKVSIEKIKQQNQAEIEELIQKTNKLLGKSSEFKKIKEKNDQKVLSIKEINDLKKYSSSRSESQVEEKSILSVNSKKGEVAYQIERSDEILKSHMNIIHEKEKSQNKIQNTLNENTNAINQRVSEKVKIIKNLEKELKEKSSIISKLNTKLDKQNLEILKLNDKLLTEKQIRNENIELNKKLKIKEDESKKFEEIIQAMSLELKEKTESLKMFQNINKDLESKYNSSVDYIKSLENNVKSLKTLLEKESNNRNANEKKMMHSIANLIHVISKYKTSLSELNQIHGHLLEKTEIFFRNSNENNFQTSNLGNSNLIDFQISTNSNNHIEERFD